VAIILVRPHLAPQRHDPIERFGTRDWVAPMKVKPDGFRADAMELVVEPSSGLLTVIDHSYPHEGNGNGL